jgi:hypothetical protein
MNNTKLRYLSEKDLDCFERDGFVIFRGMYDFGEIHKLSAWIDEIAAQELVPARGAAAFAAGLDERRRAADDGFAFLARVRSRISAEDRVRAALTAPASSMPLRLVRAAPWWPAAAAAAAALALLLLGSGGGTAVAADSARDAAAAVAASPRR